MWAGYTAAVTDEALILKNYTYDPLGRLVTVQENPNGSPAGTTTSYTYDYGDRLRQVIQGSQSLSSTTWCPGNAASSRCFAYDALGRLVASVNPESGTITYGYDHNGNMISKTMPVTAPNPTISYTYDHLNRVTGKTYPNPNPQSSSNPDSYSNSTASPVTYCYDGSTAATGCAANPPASYSVGRLTMTTNGSSTTSILAYDQLGRVLQSQQTPAGGMPYSFTYAYNLLDGITSETYPSGRVVTTNYDSAGRILNVQNSATGASYATWPSPSGCPPTCGYAANGATTSLTLGNGVVETTTFNRRFQPTQITAGSILTLGLTYGTGANGTVGNNGNVQTESITWPSASFNQYFVYDPMNRLVFAAENPGTPPSTAYSATTNFTSCGVTATIWCEPATYDVYGNRLIGTPTGLGSPINVPTAFTSNPRTNQNAGGSWLYDSSGNIITDGSGNQYTYDAENRQITAGTSTYVYDGDGHRVLRTTSSGQTTYVYDAAGNLAAEYGTAPLTVTGTTYLTADHLGSTRLVTSGSNTYVNGTLQSAGTALECRDYLPFGEVLTVGRNNACASSDVGVAELFTSKERDAETGLDFFGERYLSAAQGRFMSVDQGAWFLFNPQSYNGYSYGLNNPLRYDDVAGESPRDRVNLAQQLATQNIPYGSTNPQSPDTCFDCSGLVRYVFQNDPDNTLKLPRTAEAQELAFQSSGEYTGDIAKGRPGDAIFFANSSDHVVHTGIVVDIKDGQIRFVHAPRPGYSVGYASIGQTGLFGRRGQANAEHFVGFGRPMQHLDTAQPKTATAAQNGGLGSIFDWFGSLFSSPPSPPLKAVATTRICYADENGKQACQ